MGAFDDLIPSAPRGGLSRLMQAQSFSDLRDVLAGAPAAPGIAAPMPAPAPRTAGLVPALTAPAPMARPRAAPAPAAGPEPAISRPLSAWRSFVGGASEGVANILGGLGMAGQNAESMDSGLQRAALTDRLRFVNDRLHKAQGLLDTEQGPHSDAMMRSVIQYTQERDELLAELAAIETPKPYAEQPLVKAGDSVRAFTDRVVGQPDPAYAGDFFTSTLPQGAGSMVSFLPTAVLGPAGPALAGASMSADATYREALAKGASEDDARTAAGWAALVGTTEAAPIMLALRPLGPRVASAFLRRVGENAVEEGAQEAFQGVMQNLIARGFYDPERGVFEDVPEQALVGAILGGTMGGAAGLIRSEPAPAAPSPVTQPPAAPRGVTADVGAPFAQPYDGLAAVLGGAPTAPAQPAPDPEPRVSTVPDMVPPAPQAPAAPVAPAPDLAAVLAGAPQAPAGINRSQPAAPAAPARTDTPPAVGAASLPPAAQTAAPGILGPDEEYMDSDVGIDGQPIDPVPGIWNNRLKRWRPLEAGQGTLSPDQVTPPQVDSAAPAAPMSQPAAPNVTSPDPRADLAAALAGPVAVPVAPVAAPQPPSYEAAVQLVRESGKASASYLQRKLGLRHADAQAMLGRMEADGIVSPPGRNGARTISAPAAPVARPSGLAPAFQPRTAEPPVIVPPSDRGPDQQDGAAMAAMARRNLFADLIPQETPDVVAAAPEPAAPEEAVPAGRDGDGAGAVEAGATPDRDEISGLPIVNAPTPASFWSYKADAPPDYAMLPEGIFTGTRQEWESLSPGMRREIVRTAQKYGPNAPGARFEAQKVRDDAEATDVEEDSITVGRSKNWQGVESASWKVRQLRGKWQAGHGFNTPAGGSFAPFSGEYDSREAAIGAALNQIEAKAQGTLRRPIDGTTNKTDHDQARAVLQWVAQQREKAGIATPGVPVTQKPEAAIPVADDRAEQKKREAREAGRAAARAGEPRTAPDFLAGSDLADDWLAGYAESAAIRAAREEREDVDRWRAESTPGSTGGNTAWRVERRGGRDRENVWGYYATQAEAVSAAEYANQQGEKEPAQPASRPPSAPLPTPSNPADMDPQGTDAARFWRDLSPEAQTAALAAAGVEKTRPRPWQFVAKIAKETGYAVSMIVAEDGAITARAFAGAREAVEARAKKEGLNIAFRALPEPRVGNPVMAEDMSREDAKALDAALRDGQPDTEVDAAINTAILHQKVIADRFKMIGAQTGATVKAGEKVKERASLDEKMARKGYRDVREVTDIARGGFEIESLGQAEAVVRQLYAKFAVMDEGWNVTPYGYFDRKLIIRFDDGALAEVKIWPKELLRAKSEPTLYERSGHDYYKLADAKGTPADVKADAIEKQKAIYAEGLRLSPPDIRAVASAKMASPRPLNAAAKSPRDSSDLRMSDRSASADAPSRTEQSRPAVSTTSGDSSSSSTAGSPSQSKNRITSSVSDASNVGEPSAPNISTPAAQDKAWGQGNTIFTADAAQKARELLRKKLNGSQLNAGIDPEVVQAGITLAGYHIEAGARRFSDYARAMVADLGESVRPYLRSWYEGVRYYPGFDAEGMTPAAEISDADGRGLDQDGSGEAGTAAPDRGAEGPGAGEALDAAPATDGEAAAGAGAADPAGERADAPQDGSGDGVRQGRDGAERGADRGDERVPDAGAGDGADAGARPSARPSRPNYVLDKPERIVGGTPKQRFAKNRAAIEALQTIEQEGREPTQAELDAMAAYTGWGAFGQELFQGSWDRPLPKHGWAEESQWLRDTLGETAWKGAQASIINAHYTDPPTVKAMWGIAERLGFKGGRVLEPSMGVGNFFSMMPQEIAQASDLTGIELDPTTGAMAKHLFPQANIRIMGYEKSKTPDGFYDLVIGNWPFANVSPADRRYDRLGLSLHNYFFVKALDQTRPGGLVVGVTSRFTMDAQGRQARMEMAKRADLVAAFRLPTGAFEEYAGTAVVTDIIVLRKRETPNPDPAKEAWVNTGTVKLGWQNEDFAINQYFLDNPSNVLGEIALGQRTTYGAPGLTVTRQDNFPRRLAALPSRAPEGVYQPIVRGKEPRFTANQTTEREGAVVEKGGDLHVVQGDRLANLHDVKPWRLKDEAETAKRLQQFKDLIAIRRQYEALIAAERAGGADIESIRATLRNLHSGFVAAHGPMIDSFALKHMERVDDPHYATLAALEGPDGRPAAILERSTMRPAPSLTNPSVRDAYVLARNENTVLDVARVAELAGVDEATARAELIESGAVYAVPGGGVEAADVYLSGNVVRKLAEARDAQDRGEDMARSIAALEKARPAKVPYFSIEPQLGATWISVQVHQRFIAEALGVESVDGIDIRMVGGGWRVKLSKALLARPEAKAGMGSADVRFDRLITAAMGNRPLVVMTRDEDGKPVKDDAASKRASEAAQRVREQFGEWAYKDAERRLELEREYNDTFRAVADPQFDGSFLTFPGLARQFYGGDFDLRQHQRNAVWRGVANGYGIYAHEVGTGKTATAAAIAVESKRYGKAKKPVLFAHNANSRAVYAEAQGMYPGANMLFVDNLSPKTIKTTLRRIANDDWDLIVMPHSVIDRLSFKEETLRALAQDQIAALEQEALEAADDDGYRISLHDLDDPDAIKKMRSVTAKELAKQRLRILSQIDKMAGRANRGEDTINFEDLGIDMILVDEAHVFKKPPIATKMQMRGLNKQASDRSIALQFITDYVKAQRGGTGIHLFTGTPITNTLGEIFHMSRYVISKDMEAANIADWDAWFNTFAAAGADVEPAAGGGFDIVTRLRKFVNVAELRRMMGTALDVVFADDMPEFSPRATASGKTMGDEALTEAERDELLNGRSPNAIGRPYKVTINDIAPITPSQRAWMEQIAAWARAWKSMDGKARLEAMKSGAPESPIIHENIAPKVGLDLRMVEQGAPDEPDSKINRAARRILHHYQESPDGAQVVFAEVGDARESKVAGSTIILDRSPIEDLIEKLVAGGVRRDEVAIVGGGVKPEQKQAIAAKVNRGEVRVVIGKTETLGTGVNMQKRLRAMHHLDAPWMPGQLEQRNGRGWRQGNQWNTVYEYRYITEGIDGARWNVLAVKDRFIQDFKRADDSVREIEGDAVDDAEKADGDSIMATLSEAIGDPRVLQKEKLTKDVERLNRKERLHTEGVADTISRARRSRQEATQIEREVKEGWEPDAALAEAVKAAEGFEAKIGNRTYQKRADAADALQREAQRAMPEIMRTNSTSDVVKVGEIYGLDIVAGRNVGSGWQGGSMVMAVRGKRLHPMGATSLASAESVIRGIPKKAADKAAEAADLRKSADRLDAMAKQPFALADQLAKRKAMLAEIDADLRDNPVAPPMWLRRGAPVDTKIKVRGETRIVRGHRWATNGWFVLTDEGPVPYLDARDQYGVPVYQEVPFSEPADGSAVEIDPRYLLDGQDKTLTEMALDDDGNLIVRERRASPYSDLTNNDRFRAATSAESMARLRRMLDHYGLKRVQLAPDMAGLRAGRQGAFATTARDEFMAILIGASFDPAATLNHEVIHALRAANLFTDAEWAILEQAARDRWMAKHKIAERYGDLAPELQIEEAIAEAFADGMRGAESQILRGGLRIALARVKRFFQIVKRWLGLQKLDSPDAIFGAVAEGVIGRGPARGRAGLQKALAEQRGKDGWDATAWRRAMNTAAGLKPGATVQQARDDFSAWRGTTYGPGDAIGAQALFSWADNSKGDRGRGGNAMRDDPVDALAGPNPFAVRAEQRPIHQSQFFQPAPSMMQAYRQTQGTYAAIRAGTSPRSIETTFDELRRQLQDKMLPLMRAQQLLERAGVQVSEEADVYLTEETYSGRVGSRLRAVERRYIEPVMEMIAKSEGLTIDSVARYLTARHAPERNAHIASINRAMPDGGAGFDSVANVAWTTQHAQNVRAQMEAGPDGARLREIAKLMRGLRRRSVAMRVEHGLLSKKEGRAWLDGFKEYVPLKGFAETDSIDTTGTGAGFNAGGRETRQAMGRASEAFNPLVAAFTQAQEAIVRGEKNRVGQALYELAKAAPPGNGLFEVKKVTVKRWFNQSTGLVETRAVTPITVPQAQRELAMKIDGKEHRVVIHDPAIMEAMKGLGAERMNAVLRMSREVTQWLSMANTMFSPSFTAVNAARDFLTAHIQAPAMAGPQAGAIMAEVRGNYLSALRGAARALKGDYSGEWGRAFKAFEQAGGKIEFFKIERPEDSLLSLQARMRIATGKGSLSDHLGDWQRKRVFAWIERMNMAVDNAMRLAAFKAATDRGWTDARAASLAKNLTVNFNRRGQQGAALNAVIMFFNAGMQGTHMLARAMHRRDVWTKFLLPLVALGVAEDIIMSAISPEDDDGELAYDKVPAWQRSMALLWGGDSGFAAPLPYGYNMFAFLGKQISRTARGGVEAGQAFAEVVQAALTSVSPPIVPTLYEPYRAWTQNTDWRGRPIRPEYAFNDFGPKSHKAYGSTSDIAKAIAASLNWMTGGSEHHAGAVDIAPGYLDHFAGWVAGGIGRFTQDVWRSGEALFRGEAPELSAIPIVDRLGFSTGIWLDRERFYQRRDEVMAAAKVLKDGGRAAITPRDAALLRTKERLTESERALRRLRSERTAAYEMPAGAARTDRLQRIEAREQAALDAFNGAYNAAVRGR